VFGLSQSAALLPLPNPQLLAGGPQPLLAVLAASLAALFSGDIVFPPQASSATDHNIETETTNSGFNRAPL
jgi:hypothetical protein